MRITTYKSYINEHNQNYLVRENSTYYSAFNSLCSMPQLTFTDSNTKPERY